MNMGKINKLIVHLERIPEAEFNRYYAERSELMAEEDDA